MKKNNNLKFYFYIILILIICTGCQKKELEISFILPDNEEKPYFLVKKESAKELKIINNKLTIKFDKSRLLYVKSFSPLESWHKIKAFEESENHELKELNNFKEVISTYFVNLELDVVIFLNSPSEELYKEFYNMTFKDFLKLTDPDRLEKLLSDEAKTPKKKRPEEPKE